MMYVKIKRLTETAILPTKGSAEAAGYDLYVDTNEDVIVFPGECKPFYTGLAMEIPQGYAGFIYSRSGTATRKGLRLPHCVAVIDSDFRGNIGIPLRNDSDTEWTIKAHERVAQIVFQRVENVDFTKVDQLSETKRGTGGFGSTGR